MSSLNEDLRGIDALSDSLRDVERDVFHESQIREQLQDTLREQKARREAIRESMRRLRESKSRLLSSISEKECILSSNRFLERVASDEVHRLKSSLQLQLKEGLEFSTGLRATCKDMETLLSTTFGPEAIQVPRLVIQKIKEEIRVSKSRLGSKAGELSALESEMGDLKEKLELQSEANSLERDLEDLSQRKSELEAGIRETRSTSCSSPAKSLNLNVSLEASTYNKYPKLMDGSSFFKKTKKSFSTRSMDHETPPEKRGKDNYPNLLGGWTGLYDRKRKGAEEQDEISRAKKNLSFESPSYSQSRPGPSGAITPTLTRSEEEYNPGANEEDNPPQAASSSGILSGKDEEESNFGRDSSVFGRTESSSGKGLFDDFGSKGGGFFSETTKDAPNNSFFK